jgi:hypothetical protein
MRRNVCVTARVAVTVLAPPLVVFPDHTEPDTLTPARNFRSVYAVFRLSARLPPEVLIWSVVPPCAACTRTRFPLATFETKETAMLVAVASLLKFALWT